MNPYPIRSKEDQADVDAFSDMFSELPPLDPFDIKKEEVAAFLSALLSHSNVSRTELAEKLGWKKSRVTAALSGKNNLTLRTIFEIAYCLKFDFDVVFRGFQETCARQPWQNVYARFEDSKSDAYVVYKRIPSKTLLMKAQTASEVSNDLAADKGAQLYLSVINPEADVRPRAISRVIERKSISLRPRMTKNFWGRPANSVREKEAI